MTNNPSQTPSVLFVCVKNGGKSQIAAALMRHHAGDTVDVFSAGTEPGENLNTLAVQSVEEIGASLDSEHPKAIDPTLLSSVDRVIVLGNEAQIEPVPGMQGSIETWMVDEPSERGITGPERMRLVRDDINQQVLRLYTELVGARKPRVLFVCVHNAGRSQMAAGYLTHLSEGRIDVFSAGSAPAESLNPVAVEAIAEEHIDITSAVPKLLTTNAVQEADVVITMGCGDTCPIFPGKRYEDWELQDPAGKPLDEVREIRDDIKHRVTTLINELLPSQENQS